MGILFKKTNKDYNLKWEILFRTKTKLKSYKTCDLCSLGKYEIEKFKISKKERKDNNSASVTKTYIQKKQKKKTITKSKLGKIPNNIKTILFV